MSATSFAGSDLAVRGDLVEAHELAWAAIAASGTGLNGQQRVAVAAEIRRASGRASTSSTACEAKVKRS